MYGKDGKGIDRDGRTLLFKAAENGNLIVVKYLVFEWLNVNAKDRFANTPLHAAAFGGNLEVVKLLVSEGADAKAKGNNSVTGAIQIPRDVARRNRNTEIANYLNSL